MIKDDSVYRKGVVQEMPPSMLPEIVGFHRGDTIYYTKAIRKTEHGDYVDIENVLCMNLQQ